MKGIDILFCTSKASTAICHTIHEPSSYTPSSPSPPSKSSISTIGRHNTITRDEKRITKSFITPPCSNPQHPISPKPNHHHKSILSGNNKTKKGISGKKSSKISEQKIKGQGGWGCSKTSSFISPPSSSRYLLSDKALLNVLNDFDPVLTLVQNENSEATKIDGPSFSSYSSASKVQPPSPSSPLINQVVVLRVSLHCKGCERKMRKHLSKMEGVTSFNIDFEAKKLTVVGNVTPSSVLASVSKVKNATLLTPMTISSSAPIPPPHHSDASSTYRAGIKIYQEQAL